VRFYLLLLAFLLAAPGALGHVPLLPEGNDNISSAEYISDPDKSWAIYSQLEPDQAEYYSFDVEKAIGFTSLCSAPPIQEKRALNRIWRSGSRPGFEGRDCGEGGSSGRKRD
jgi:hypothetical protein